MSPIVVTGEGQTVKITTGTTTLKVVHGGPRGPRGPKGDPGIDRTQRRHYGEGPPGLIIGAQPGDEYVDALTGTLYVLN